MDQPPRKFNKATLYRDQILNYMQRVNRPRKESAIRRAFKGAHRIPALGAYLLQMRREGVLIGTEGKPTKWGKKPWIYSLPEAEGITATPDISMEQGIFSSLGSLEGGDYKSRIDIMNDMGISESRKLEKELQRLVCVGKIERIKDESRRYYRLPPRPQLASDLKE